MTVTGGGNPQSDGREEPAVGPATPSGVSRSEPVDRPGDQPPLSELIAAAAYGADCRHHGTDRGMTDAQLWADSHYDKDGKAYAERGHYRLMAEAALSVVSPLLPAKDAAMERLRDCVEFAEAQAMQMSAVADRHKAERDEARSALEEARAEVERLSRVWDELIADLSEEIAWQKQAYRDGTDKVATGRTIGMEDALHSVRKSLGSLASGRPAAQEAPAPIVGKLIGDDRVSLGEALHSLDLLDDEDLSGVTFKAAEWFEQWLSARSASLPAAKEAVAGAAREAKEWTLEELSLSEGDCSGAPEVGPEPWPGSLAFFAGVRFGSAQRRVDHILDKELYQPPVNPQALADEGEASGGGS